VGGRRLKSGLFYRYVIVEISEALGDNHSGHKNVTPALAHDRSDNYSSAPCPESRVFKFEENSKKGCYSFEKKNVFPTERGMM
jgi:hypothetical protein